MSYGQPWRRTTARPSAGPTSAYPTCSRPAALCSRGPNAAVVRGLLGAVSAFSPPVADILTLLALATSRGRSDGPREHSVRRNHRDRTRVLHWSGAWAHHGTTKRTQNQQRRPTWPQPANRSPSASTSSHS